MKDRIDNKCKISQRTKVKNVDISSLGCDDDKDPGSTSAYVHVKRRRGEGSMRMGRQNEKVSKKYMEVQM